MRRVLLLIECLSLCALAPSTPAQLVGSEFRVNTYTTGQQDTPNAAMHSDGSFVVIWSSSFESAAGQRVFARRFASSGAPLTNGFEVSSGTGNQRYPAVGVLLDGSFVVAWGAPDGSSYGAFGQRFDPAGAPQGGAFRVNTTTTGGPGEASVVGTAGGFVVTFQCRDGFSEGICLQRFNASGAPVAGELRVNQSSSGAQYDSAAASDATGHFVVVWEDSGIGDDANVSARLFDSSAAPLGSEITVVAEPRGSYSHKYAKVAVDASGPFTVAWNAGDGDGYGIFARRYDAIGSPLGAAFRVNTATTGVQSRPVIGAGPGGSFLVVWRGNDSAGGRRNVAQLFGPSGSPIGGEFRLSTFTIDAASTNALTKVGTDRNGNFVVTWHRSIDSYDVVARRLVMPPEPDGSEFRVNTATTSFQQYAQVGRDGSGNFVVVWESRATLANGFDVAVQRFTPDGIPIGGELRVNTYTTADQGAATVSAAGSGFVVCWSGDEVVGILCQRFTGAGGAAGTAFRVNGDTTGTQGLSRVASDASGNFVVTWVSPDGDALGIFARRFAGTGAPLGAAFRVNTVTGGDQESPDVAAQPAGGFVVVWQGPSADSNDIVAQRFGVSGAPIGGEFRVNQLTTSYQFFPAVAVDAAGGFVVAWQSYGVLEGSNFGISVRRFSAAAQPLTSEFAANVFTTNGQGQPSVAGDAAGGFVVTWTSLGQDGSYHGIFQRAYKSTGEPASSVEFQVNTYTTGSQTYPAVSVGKNVMIVWTGAPQQDGDEVGVFAQLYRRACRSSDEDGNGAVNVSDVLYLINHLFAGGPVPTCGGDANGDGLVNVSDVLYLINYLFAGGPAPA